MGADWRELPELGNLGTNLLLTSLERGFSQGRLARECRLSQAQVSFFGLSLLGRSALVLGYGVRLMTKDVDIADIHSSRLLGIAVEIFRKGGSGHAAQDFHLETVS